MNITCNIFNIGTELVTGKILDTNSYYLSGQLFQLGIEVTAIHKIPDSPDQLKKELINSLENNDLLIATGGLGPTEDDITKDMIKAIWHLEYYYSEKIYKNIEKLFHKRKMTAPKTNKVQAYVFKGSIILPNAAGTAPGFIIEKHNKTIILLPGPPYEMIPMFKKYVIPYLKKKYKLKIYQKVIRLYGLAESTIAEKLLDYDRQIKTAGGNITYLAKPNLVDIIITGRKNMELLTRIAAKIKKMFIDHLYSEKWYSLYEVVHRILIDKRLTLSIAESCTGGLISKTITDLPGSSKYFLYDIICYSDQAKTEILSVKKSTLKKAGAVSKETTAEMIKGLSQIIKTDITVSVTGIAGPGGGSKDKPVGLVYIGVKYKKQQMIKRFIFSGNREKIRMNVLNKVYELILKMLHDHNRKN